MDRDTYFDGLAEPRKTTLQVFANRWYRCGERKDSSGNSPSPGLWDQAKGGEGGGGVVARGMLDRERWVVIGRTPQQG